MSSRALTVREVAEQYAVSQHTVLGWIARGELRAINCGRAPGKRKPRWRITPEALEQFELLRTNNPPPPRTRRRRQAEDYLVERY